MEVEPAPSEKGDLREAMHGAGKLLERRARSEFELRERLAGAGLDRETVDRAIQRLVALRLIDDHSFASQWVTERSARKGLAPAALVAELEAKGVSRATAEAALSEAALDEGAQAREVAVRLSRKVAGRPTAIQATRLLGMLARRGFSPESAAAGVRAVLPPDGWD
ncbi:MAG: regulatory protein RecX [Actinobacteria bacterium]|nr:regulatory protein RecX [Actinomycetota bacterium]